MQVWDKKVAQKTKFFNALKNMLWLVRDKMFEMSAEKKTYLNLWCMGGLIFNVLS